MKKVQIGLMGLDLAITKILEVDVDRERDITVSPSPFTQDPAMTGDVLTIARNIAE